MRRNKKFFKNCKVIESYYKYLITLTNNNDFVGSTNEWLIDNYYIVSEIKINVEKILASDTKSIKILKQNNEVYELLNNLYLNNNFNVTYGNILNCLKSYQKDESNYLDYEVISFIPIMLIFIVIDRLAVLCKTKGESQKEKQKIRNLIKLFKEKLENNEQINLNDYIILGDDIDVLPAIIEQLNDSLKELGKSSSELFTQLDELLSKKGLVLKDLISKENTDSINNNILIANIFNSLKIISKLKVVNLYDKLNKAEAIMKKDKVYNKVTLETKELYRTSIIKKAKKRHISQYKYACEVLKRSIEENKHIGFYLVENKNINLRSKLYIITIFLLTIIISALLSFITLDYWWLAFILLLVPISELVIQLVNKFLMQFLPCNPLPKIDYSKGIDSDNQTVVVMPTIIKDTKKIDKMYNALEKYYLANKSDNLYFTLLGDCSESDELENDNDKIIAEYGISKTNALNKKYGKNVFSFVYRKRVFNTSEGKYLGYERKRGALIHFNNLLLNKLNDKEKYIYVENISEKNYHIKYVITIDTDTELVLNSALSLVGVMAHPLNKPVLNSSKTKVIKGHALIQPRVNVDIESTNNSIYSQLMAGLGGFDVYSSVIPNFYQDMFDEGSFIGKGIYDLDIFEQVLSNTFPENLVLSHDLLEGNYLRCGFASDIEFIDDFPATFLVESSRQHRWSRGDTQIIGWLFNKIKNKKGKKIDNPLNLIERFKIFDNIRRMWFNPSLLTLVILSFVCGNPYITSLITVLIVCLPMIFYIKDLLQKQNKKLFTFKYYDNLMFGFLSILWRIVITLVTIPYYAYLYLDAFFRALYRMYISHKKLLNWITAEDASKTIKNDLLSYIKAFKVNYFVVLILIFISVVSSNYLLIAIIISVFLLSAPIILYNFSKKNEKEEELNDNQIEKIKNMAFKTWLYFDELLTSENNYLIPDNLQLNREIKEDFKTSPTDIGMSINSVVSACELEFITLSKANMLLDHIVTSIEKLEKWHGHLYNWYNIKTMKKIVPFVVSSVDSGNLCASLLVAKEFCIKKNNILLANRIATLFDNTNFSKLYTKQDVFSIAYDTVSEELSIYNYNKFASESRILSFIAIIKGDVPSKHWKCLDKTLTKYKKRKGLVSWSGTSFEYFMPLIFMKSYPNTLLDESYFFSKFCQKSYVNEIDSKMPWGISESAYDELDDGLNYKYKVFSTPYLKMIDEKGKRIVISPYASALAITNDPADVYNNLKKLQKLGMYGEYGFYESYDYSTSNIVNAYYAHHQGMILSSLTNYLTNNVIQAYFHSDLRVQSFEILLKEKVQLDPMIDMKVVGYKKYNYEREKIENDIREYDYISDIPQLSLLSNSKYCLLVNDRGNGFSRYNSIQLNRYRKITEQDYGTYLYIKDLKNKKVWSNTFAPTNVKPEKYNVVFANDRIKFSRLDDEIITQTEIIVTKNHNAEIRKFTFKNLSNEVKALELTSYNEVIIEENIDDIIHRTFRNLFISSRFDSNTNTLIMQRKNNTKKITSYMFGRLFTDNKKNDISYETERSKFIGRNHTPCNPIGVTQKLNNNVGTNIDPILSLRTRIEIQPEKETTVYYIQGFSKSLDGINSIVDSYLSAKDIKKAFEYATLSNNATTKLLGIDGSKIRIFNIMLNYLYQTSRHFVNDERKDLLTKNALNQKGLWKFNISGDRPIILVDIKKGESFRLAKDLIYAFEYFKSKSLHIDLVIINSEEEKYKNIIRREVEQEIYRMDKLFTFSKIPGNIYLLERDSLTEEENILIHMVARLSFSSDSDISLEDAINQMHLNNKIIDFPKRNFEKAVNEDYDISKVENYNDYGGFINNGKEYIITNTNTPVPWSNVLANPGFGSIITNNECGFTYSYNSQMFKLTSWSNDIVVNDKSEGIDIDGMEIQSSICKHGFGYSVFEHNSKNYKLTDTQFVAHDSNIKFYNLKLTNTMSELHKYHVTFWINPTLGPNEEKSSRYLLSEYFKDINAVVIRNVYNPDYSGVSVFMSSDIPITDVSVDRIIYKSISIDVELKPNETKAFSFMLGTAIGENELQTILNKYKNVDEEHKMVSSYWADMLDVVQVKTPDKSLDYMLNGWYLYQVIASRLFARAGFYQVGGAYGFRDQLQDAMNICEVHPEITRSQIITNAMHQFKKGDVLHWWHTDNHLGLRSMYMDDFLWLVYATNKYIKVTDDSEILKEKICFVIGDELINEEEKGVIYSYTNETDTLLNHILLAINRTVDNMGKNGLPLMYGGDWNDGMNKIGKDGLGTSVWLGFFAYMVIKDFSDTCKKNNIKIKSYDKFLNNLKNSLNDIAWEDEYYIRAFFDNGDKLGSHFNEECKIDLISQSFAILSEVIPKNRIKKVINSVEKYLVDKNFKIIKLLTPPFENSKNNPGYIMDYPSGIRENGGQYTHSTIWYIMALIKTGYISKAYEYYQMINPINRSLTRNDVNTYCVEPYVIAADIYSNNNYKGRGGWTWYTGSAGWYYNVGLTSILGFNKNGNKVTIEPNVPNDWDYYELNYKYMSSLYKFKVKLKQEKDSITIDRKKSNFSFVELIDDGKTHNVIIEVRNDGNED